MTNINPPLHRHAPVTPGRGRSRTRVMRDQAHALISVKALAESLPRSSYRTLAWREGTRAPLRSRFARVRVRVRAAQANRPRPEEWLLIAGKPKNAAAHALNAPPLVCLTG